MSHGSEEGENYWPGYVDALTSMVQVLAFVMMMLAMAVFVLSQSVSKKAVEAIAKAVNAEVKPDADVKQLTQAVIAQIDRLQKSSSAIEIGARAGGQITAGGRSRGSVRQRPANDACGSSAAQAQPVAGRRRACRRMRRV